MGRGREGEFIVKERSPGACKATEKGRSVFGLQNTVHHAEYNQCQLIRLFDEPEGAKSIFELT